MNALTHPNALLVDGRAWPSRWLSFLLAGVERGLRIFLALWKVASFCLAGVGWNVFLGGVGGWILKLFTTPGCTVSSDLPTDGLKVSILILLF